MERRQTFSLPPIDLLRYVIDLPARTVDLLSYCIDLPAGGLIFAQHSLIILLFMMSGERDLSSHSVRPSVRPSAKIEKPPAGRTPNLQINSCKIAKCNSQKAMGGYVFISPCKKQVNHIKQGSRRSGTIQVKLLSKQPTQTRLIG